MYLPPKNPLAPGVLSCLSKVASWPATQGCPPGGSRCLGFGKTRRRPQHTASAYVVQIKTKIRVRNIFGAFPISLTDPSPSQTRP
ncbi:hypothetical protein GALMADRAFT_251505 [Galerina marginata CBS 339.88]|uniref:Uncharacterized protein n=1 Tax=Galerina marginata (strain CBS 339.88) TaxID=685588 RepID=A0A067T186_GALM3|nr:hypothetical protein GALMADRAFT_251505 [Galerina marginata CBS 339.88]